MSTAAEWRDKATHLREKGDLEGALEYWVRAGEAGLPEEVVQCEMAVVHLTGGDAPRAREILEALVGASPHNGVQRNLLGTALCMAGHEQEAVAQWEEAGRLLGMKLCPLSTHPLYLSLAMAAIESFLQQQSPPSSIAADMPELSGSAARRLARIEKALLNGEGPQALEWMEKEIQTGVGASESARLLYALALAETRNWAKAREELLAFLSDNHPHPSAQAFLGYCLARQGEPDLALAILDRVEEAGPDDYFANYFRGLALLLKGTRRPALQAFERAFADYFFDTWHYVVIPAWKKMRRCVLPTTPDR